VRDRPSLLDVHGALADLAFAVRLTLEPLNVGISIHWHNAVYLSVEIECRYKDAQMIVDRLRHGALARNYDYRFRSISHPTGRQPEDWITVSAYPDMSFDHAKKGG